MMLLLLSRFSHVRFCATPWAAAHQASPSMGFSRQEHWSGLPFPSPIRESESEVSQLCQLLVTPWAAAHQAPPSMGFSRQEYWSGLPLPSLCIGSGRCKFTLQRAVFPQDSCGLGIAVGLALPMEGTNDPRGWSEPSLGWRQGFQSREYNLKLCHSPTGDFVRCFICHQI